MLPQIALAPFDRIANLLYNLLLTETCTIFVDGYYPSKRTFLQTKQIVQEQGRVSDIATLELEELKLNSSVSKILRTDLLMDMILVKLRRDNSLCREKV